MLSVAGDNRVNEVSRVLYGQTVEQPTRRRTTAARIDGTHMMRSAVFGLPMWPGLELGSIESARRCIRLRCTRRPDAMRCARYYDDFAVSHFYSPSDCATLVSSASASTGSSQTWVKRVHNFVIVCSSKEWPLSALIPSTTVLWLSSF
jgi:hypothetical protein